MPAHDNTYSRIVAWLKVLLPVLALVLLSTMFLTSRAIDPNVAIRIADVDVKDLADTQRITGPRYSGVTEDGAALSFSASAAQPDPENPAIYTVTDLKARIETPDGAAVAVQAGRAVVDSERGQVRFDGDVSLETSTDFSIRAQGLELSMDRTWAGSIGPVVADGPLGHVEAGQVELLQQGQDSGTYVLVFKDGVKMVYTPESHEDE